MSKYQTVVGLEIHAHLKTESKMFCACATGPKGADYSMTEKDEPNIRVCPVCTGQPGTLPVPNRKAIEDTILLGLALGSEIPTEFNFERKNYYYPDLPKAYQITSATNPPVKGGGLEITNDTGAIFIELDHIHLEEDAGKLTHPKSGEYSLVDLNRAGTPLLEIITKPVIKNGKDAVNFMKNLQAILRFLGISDADMEKGQMRCDANISIKEPQDAELGTKVEIKNMNSFKMIEKAIDYEVTRQAELLSSGKRVEQETRGWDDNRGKTTPQRSKEGAHDYRYFPEPDIPVIQIGSGKDFDPEIINDRLPELPKEKRVRFTDEYGMSEHEVQLLTDNPDIARFFEEVIEKNPKTAEQSTVKREFSKAVSSVMAAEIIPNIPMNGSVWELKVSPENLSLLVGMIFTGEISGKIAKEVIPEMLKTGASAQEIISSKGLSQISDEQTLTNVIRKVMDNNKDQVAAYRSGKLQLYGFFVGQVMKETSGQANPKITNELLKKELA